MRKGDTSASFDLHTVELTALWRMSGTGHGTNPLARECAARAMVRLVGGVHRLNALG